MHNFDFFNNLSTVAKQKLLESALFIKVRAGEELYAQGDVCHDVLFLTKGRVRVSRMHKNGQSVLLYYFEKGEQCNVNFTASYTSAPAIGTAVAETDLEGYDIPAKLIAELFVEDKVFQAYVFNQYTKRLEHMATLIEEIRFKNLDERLLQWLQDQPNREIALSHEEIGDILGCSREVVSRILKGFEKNGVLALSRRNIKLL